VSLTGSASILLVCNTVFRSMQAILPLRGKILNIERKDEAAMYKNEEIQNLILGLGLGVKVIYPFSYPAVCWYVRKTQFDIKLISGRRF